MALLTLVLGCGGATDNGTGRGPTGGRSYVPVPAAGGAVETGGALNASGGIAAAGGSTPTGGTWSTTGAITATGGVATSNSGTCVPWTCPVVSAGACNDLCGLHEDGCGGVVDCGSCCCPLTCEQACPYGECGSAYDGIIFLLNCPKADGCGGIIECWCKGV